MGASCTIVLWFYEFKCDQADSPNQLKARGRSQLLSDSTSVASDLDGDGAVGAGDLIEFLSEFGYTISDADGDGVCD